MSAPALYQGGSHASGNDIPVIVDGVKEIRVEGDEYKICEAAFNSDEVISLKAVTNREALDYIHKEFSCKFKQHEADSGDFIICKRVVKDDEKKDRHGTVKQILNEMQGEGGCKVEFGKGGTINSNHMNRYTELREVVSRNLENITLNGLILSEPQDRITVILYNTGKHGRNVSGIYSTTFLSDVVKKLTGKTVVAYKLVRRLDNSKHYHFSWDELEKQIKREHRIILINQTEIVADTEMFTTGGTINNDAMEKTGTKMEWRSRVVVIYPNSYDVVFNSRDHKEATKYSGENRKKYKDNGALKVIVNKTIYPETYPEGVENLADGGTITFDKYIAPVKGKFPQDAIELLHRQYKTGNTPDMRWLMQVVEKIKEEDRAQSIKTEHIIEAVQEIMRGNSNMPLFTADDVKNILGVGEPRQFSANRRKKLGFLTQDDADKLLNAVNVAIELRNSDMKQIFQDYYLPLIGEQSSDELVEEIINRYKYATKARVSFSPYENIPSFQPLDFHFYFRYPNEKDFLEARIITELSHLGASAFAPSEDTTNFLYFTYMGKRFMILDNDVEFKLDCVDDHVYIDQIDYSTVSKTCKEIISRCDDYVHGKIKGTPAAVVAEGETLTGNVTDKMMEAIHALENDVPPFSGGTMNPDLYNAYSGLLKARTAYNHDAEDFQAQKSIKHYENEVKKLRGSASDIYDEQWRTVRDEINKAKGGKAGGKNWNEDEIEAWNVILTRGKNVSCKSKTAAEKDYPNLLKDGLVYINSLGSGTSVSLELTDKGIDEANKTIDAANAKFLRFPELEPKHPLNILDPESSQYKSTLKEYNAGNYPPFKKPSTPTGKYYRGTDYIYNNAFDLNKAIEELITVIKNNSKNPEDYSGEEKIFIAQYSGMGGLIKEGAGAEGKGILYEFYTPDDIIKRMYALAYKHGFPSDGNVAETACGTGRFFKYMPRSGAGIWTGWEINPITATICRILYPQVDVRNESFETLFIKNNDTVRKNVDKKHAIYDLVITNPPYGEYKSRYGGMGERDYTKAQTWVEYFIYRGLDILKPKGLLVMVIGTEVAVGGIPFLAKGTNNCKKAIAEKSELLEAYRLPNGVFERTDVLTDIIVLRKK